MSASADSNDAATGHETAQPAPAFSFPPMPEPDYSWEGGMGGVAFVGDQTGFLSAGGFDTSISDYLQHRRGSVASSIGGDSAVGEGEDMNMLLSGKTPKARAFSTSSSQASFSTTSSSSSAMVDGEYDTLGMQPGLDGLASDLKLESEMLSTSHIPTPRFPTFPSLEST